MQKTVKGAEAHGLSKDEVQAFMQHFVAPLVQKTLRERYDQESSEVVCNGKTFNAIYDEWRDLLHATYNRIQPYEGEDPDRWRAAKDVPLKAYEPTDVPFFVTIDRAPAHSFYVGAGYKHHLRDCGVPLLQLLIMPVRGHDLHQIVEHTIGCAKAHANRVLGAARANDVQPTTEMCYKAVMDGSKLYTADSWDRNLRRLQICLRIIASPRNETLQVDLVRLDRWQNEHIRVVKVNGTYGGYCPNPWS